MIKLESYPNRREKIIAQQATRNLVLLDLESGQYYSLEEVGGRVWQLCDGTRSVSEMISIICDEYEAPSGDVRADVMELLEELIDEKLVVEAN